MGERTSAKVYRNFRWGEIDARLACLDHWSRRPIMVPRVSLMVGPGLLRLRYQTRKRKLMFGWHYTGSWDWLNDEPRRPLLTLACLATARMEAEVYKPLLRIPLCV